MTAAVALPRAPRDERLRWLRCGLVALVTRAVLQYAVLPQVAGVRPAWRPLDGVRPG